MGPIGSAVLTFIGYKQKQTDTQTSKIYIHKIKLDIRIYMLHNAYSRPNGWTDGAEFVCGHLWVAGGVIG